MTLLRQRRILVGLLEWADWDKDSIAAALLNQSTTGTRARIATHLGVTELISVRQAQKKSEKKKTQEGRCAKCNHPVHAKDDCKERKADAAGDMDWCPCGAGE